ncbi:hypothetical protein ACIQU5_09605 [Streptomyces sp. NPDC090306]|uniref:hypothetical protein n=1 Tax=Streptomyces sp. NPDC090306 TaxID=3365961 RepID=UPI0038151AE0
MAQPEGELGDAGGDLGETGETGEGAPAAPKRRRGLRTTLLVATAAVLGVVAGTCTGYLVQADREPTKLPPLSQPVVKQAKGEVEKASAAHDHQVKTEGDLRDLLLKKPKGTQSVPNGLSSDGWLTLEDYADLWSDGTYNWENEASQEFRRSAVAQWKSGYQIVEINLVQYRQVETLAAGQGSADEVTWRSEDADTDSWSIPGTGDGMAFVHNTPDTKAGYLPMYSAEAYAWRGDIAMQVWVYDTKPVPKAKILDLAKRQAAKL